MDSHDDCWIGLERRWNIYVHESPRRVGAEIGNLTVGAALLEDLW